MSEIPKPTSVGDRSAQVAHVLHGVRQATTDELGCDQCGLLLCPFCNKEGMCEPCRDTYESEQDADYEDSYYDWISAQERAEEDAEERRLERARESRHR